MIDNFIIVVVVLSIFLFSYYIFKISTDPGSDLEQKNEISSTGLSTGVVETLKIGPFLTDVTSIYPESRLFLYVYNSSIAFDSSGDIIGVSRVTGNKDCSTRNYTENEFVHSKQVDLEINKYLNYDPNYQKNLSTVIMWKLKELPKFTILPLFSSKQICNGLDTNQGIQDARLFTFRGGIWLYGHFRGYLGGCMHIPIIIPVSDPLKPSNMIKLITENMQEQEKNWMPFEVSGELYFVYSISPHIILKCDVSTGWCKKVYSSDNIRGDEILKKPVGGGTPAIKISIKGESFFLSLAHTRQINGPVVRKNFFYVFRSIPPFDIVMVGSEFDIMEYYHPIEFGSGLLLSKDEKRVIISSGISDCYSVICEYNLADVLSSLRKTPRLPINSNVTPAI